LHGSNIFVRSDVVLPVVVVRNWHFLLEHSVNKVPRCKVVIMWLVRPYIITKPYARSVHQPNNMRIIRPEYLTIMPYVFATFLIFSIHDGKSYQCHNLKTYQTIVCLNPCFRFIIPCFYQFPIGNLRVLALTVLPETAGCW
jgi:hypothetical protein